MFATNEKTLRKYALNYIFPASLKYFIKGQSMVSFVKFGSTCSMNAEKMAQIYGNLENTINIL